MLLIDCIVQGLVVGWNVIDVVILIENQIYEVDVVVVGIGVGGGIIVEILV